MTATQTDGQFAFKAEVQRVLSLVINSLYTNTEVFLRELVSNASDALDKARFLQLTEKDEVTEAEGEAAIDIRLDAEKKTLIIEDNGIGMTRDEVIENLGTIARSGTSEFAERFAELTKKNEKDAALELIGQFGVGFYAVFMVASRVDVETLSMRKGSEAVLWRSDGGGAFTVLPGDRDKPGTRITLHLKPDAEEFATRWRIEAIIKKYSDFVMFPIRIDGEVVNRSSAIWRLPKSQVSEEQHAEFFEHLTQGRHKTPLLTVHYAVDAPVQFSALVYVPDQAPPDLFMLHRERPGLRLYAKRVLIMESCDSLLPIYLRFVRGVVDSEDLQLNVSRETLQENRTVKTIEQQLTKQILKELGRLADDEPERYAAFWKELGQVLKEGLSIDYKNKDTLADLCRFETLLGEPGELSSLKQYVAAKSDDKKVIYFLTGPSREALVKSPHLEIFRKKGIDVLLMSDPIDEWVVKAIGRYDDHELVSVAHGELDLEEPATDEADKEKLGPAVAAIRAALGDKVDEVRLSSRLTETAACLVAKAGDPGANLERIMKMLDERADQKRRVLEVNPAHDFVKNLATLVARDPASPRVAAWSELLYDQALLSEGVIEDPAALVKRLSAMLVEASQKAVEG